MQITRYLALLSGGVELAAETGLGRVATPLLDARVEGRWQVPPSSPPVVVDGLGLAEEADGPLVAIHRPPSATLLRMTGGGPLIWSVHLSSFTPCR